MVMHMICILLRIRCHMFVALWPWRKEVFDVVFDVLLQDREDPFFRGGGAGGRRTSLWVRVEADIQIQIDARVKARAMPMPEEDFARRSWADCVESEV